MNTDHRIIFRTKKKTFHRKLIAEKGSKEIFGFSFFLGKLKVNIQNIYKMKKLPLIIVRKRVLCTIICCIFFCFFVSRK